MSIEVMKQAIEAIQDLRGYRPDIDKAIEALRTAIQQAESEPLTDTFVQTVPDKCDRILWRGRYLHLPIPNPAPGVHDVEDLRDRLVAISAAVADSDDRAAQSMLGEILRMLAASPAQKGGE